jgi:hypothetical protein
MDYQEMFNIAATGVSAGLGWFAREMYNAVQALKEDLYKFREEVARDYAPRSELKTMKEEIMNALHRIEDKLTK